MIIIIPIKIFGLRLFPEITRNQAPEPCPYRITGDNLESFHKRDCRFRTLTKDAISPNGRCAASPDPEHPLECGYRFNVGYCSHFQRNDLCDAGAFGGDTFEKFHRGR